MEGSRKQNTKQWWGVWVGGGRGRGAYIDKPQQIEAEKNEMKGKEREIIP